MILIINTSFLAIITFLYVCKALTMYATYKEDYNKAKAKYLKFFNYEYRIEFIEAKDNLFYLYLNVFLFTLLSIFFTTLTFTLIKNY